MALWHSSLVSWFSVSLSWFCDADASAVFYIIVPLKEKVYPPPQVSDYTGETESCAPEPLMLQHQ